MLSRITLLFQVDMLNLFATSFNMSCRSSHLCCSSNPTNVNVVANLATTLMINGLILFFYFKDYKSNADDIGSSS